MMKYRYFIKTFVGSSLKRKLYKSNIRRLFKSTFQQKGVDNYILTSGDIIVK